jgi:hypothetical protein
VLMPLASVPVLIPKRITASTHSRETETDR